MNTRRLLIIGAAGRDFHNFNTAYRANPAYHVAAFTAAQIPDIAGRKYPPQLAGELYPDGIPIYDQRELTRLISELNIHECVFSYSDVPYSHVMSLGATVNAAGADFSMLGANSTMIRSSKPVVAVGSIRTGCGKSQTSQRIADILSSIGKRAIIVRHPMPYGDLAAQAVQRFATPRDLDTHNCTIEEREEYEPYIRRGDVIYSGVDYAAILNAVENDPTGCDVVLWDGGNNDFPFFKPDFMVTVTDPHRPGHETSYYPGEVCLRLADVVVINKIDSADYQNIQSVRQNIRLINPRATIIDAASVITCDKPEVITGKRVLCIEDGPTLTHGDMQIGAGVVAAERNNAAEIVDPRAFTVGKLRETYEIYPRIGKLLPAMGYSEQQIRDLAETIERTPCDSVVVATPFDLARFIKISKPTARVTYSLQELGRPNLEDVLRERLGAKG